VRRGRLKPSSASVLLHDFPIAQAIRRTPLRRLDLLTGSLELANVDLALGGVRGREAVLRQALAPIAGAYDVIVLDGPPSLSLVTVNALVAADAVIVPVPPLPLEVEALKPLISSIQRARRHLAARADSVGILLTMVGGDAAAVAARLRREFGRRVLDTEIAASPTLQRAFAAGKPIFAFAPGSADAGSFRSLAVEVLGRLAQPSRAKSHS
jgi:chromosome partitioning protein